MIDESTCTYLIYIIFTEPKIIIIQTRRKYDADTINYKDDVDSRGNSMIVILRGGLS